MVPEDVRIEGRTSPRSAESGTPEQEAYEPPDAPFVITGERQAELLVRRARDTVTAAERTLFYRRGSEMVVDEHTAQRYRDDPSQFSAAAQGWLALILSPDLHLFVMISMSDLPAPLRATFTTEREVEEASARLEIGPRRTDYSLAEDQRPFRFGDHLFLSTNQRLRFGSVVDAPDTAADVAAYAFAGAAPGGTRAASLGWTYFPPSVATAQTERYYRDLGRHPGPGRAAYEASRVSTGREGVYLSVLLFDGSFEGQAVGAYLLRHEGLGHQLRAARGQPAIHGGSGQAALQQLDSRPLPRR